MAKKTRRRGSRKRAAEIPAFEIFRRSPVEALAEELRLTRITPPGGLVAKAERSRRARNAHLELVPPPTTKRRGRPPKLTDEEFLKYRPQRPLSDGELAKFLSTPANLGRPVTPDQVYHARHRLGIRATPSAK